VQLLATRRHTQPKFHLAIKWPQPLGGRHSHLCIRLETPGPQLGSPRRPLPAASMWRWSEGCGGCERVGGIEKCQKKGTTGKKKAVMQARGSFM